MHVHQCSTVSWSLWYSFGLRPNSVKLCSEVISRLRLLSGMYKRDTLRADSFVLCIHSLLKWLLFQLSHAPSINMKSWILPKLRGNRFWCIWTWLSRNRRAIKRQFTVHRIQALFDFPSKTWNRITDRYCFFFFNFSKIRWHTRSKENRVRFARNFESSCLRECKLHDGKFLLR